MEKLFGTDGIRGIVNKDLTADLAVKVGSSVSKVLKENLKQERLTFLIGSDTRVSKDMLTAAVSTGVLSEGCNIIDVGVLPTPAIAYLVKKYNYDGAFIISASHNPSEYNGIKVIDGNGFKLSDYLESQCEELINNGFEVNNTVNLCGNYKKENHAFGDYVGWILDYENRISLNIKPLIDTANGAAYQTANRIFDVLSSNSVDIINDKPDGYNINKEAGSTNIEKLKEEVVKGKYDLGIAFDGDADRCILVDELGNEVDGDFILAILGKDLKDRGLLKYNTIVGTVMSNLGLKEFCKNNGINFVQTKVGDKYVLREMLEKGYSLGGEQSGHIILKDYANTGDGQLTACAIMHVMEKSGKKLSELASIMTKYPQVLKNMDVTKEEKEYFQSSSEIQTYLKNFKESLGDAYNVVIRPSGTENLIRVMIEGSDITDITNKCDEVISYIDGELRKNKFVRSRNK